MQEPAQNIDQLLTNQTVQQLSLAGMDLTKNGVQLCQVGDQLAKDGHQLCQMGEHLLKVSQQFSKAKNEMPQSGRHEDHQQLFQEESQQFCLENSEQLSEEGNRQLTQEYSFSGRQLLEEGCSVCSKTRELSQANVEDIQAVMESISEQREKNCNCKRTSIYKTTENTHLIEKYNRWSLPSSEKDKLKTMRNLQVEMEERVLQGCHGSDGCRGQGLAECDGALWLAVGLRLELMRKDKFWFSALRSGLIQQLVALGHFQQGYNLLRWWASHKENPARVLPQGITNHKPKLEYLGTEMFLLRLKRSVMSSHKKMWTSQSRNEENAEIGEDLGWAFGTQGKKSKVAKCSLDKLVIDKNQHLNVLIPVLIIKLAYIEKLKAEKGNFWLFMMGTHSRVGQDSPVQKIAGLTPVIQLLYDMCANNGLDSMITRIKYQVMDLVWNCKLREFLVIFLKEEKESDSVEEVIRGCTLCRRGSDCLGRAEMMNFQVESSVKDPESQLALQLFSMAWRKVYIGRNPYKAVKAMLLQSMTTNKSYDPENVTFRP